MKTRTKTLVSLFGAILGSMVGIKHLFLWNVLCFYKTPAEVCTAYFDTTLYVSAAFFSALLVFFAVFYAITALFAFYKKNFTAHHALSHA